MKEYTAPVADVIDFATDYVCALTSPRGQSAGGGVIDDGGITVN